MDCNTPQTSKSSSLSSLPTQTSTTHTPSDVRCVTQTQDSEPLINTPESGPDHQHILNSLCAAEQSENTPLCQTPNPSFAITSVIPSLDRAIVQQTVAKDLFQTNSKRKLSKDTARKSGAVKAAKKRAYCDPSKAILWFLRKKYVDDYANEMKSKSLSTAQKYKPVYSFFRHDKRRIRKIWILG